MISVCYRPSTHLNARCITIVRMLSASVRSPSFALPHLSRNHSHKSRQCFCNQTTVSSTSCWLHCGHDIPKQRPNFSKLPEVETALGSGQNALHNLHRGINVGKGECIVAMRRFRLSWAFQGNAQTWYAWLSMLHFRVPLCLPYYQWLTLFMCLIVLIIPCRLIP